MFSIVIPVENRIWTLNQLLKSLMKNSRLDNEIIVSVSGYGKTKVDSRFLETPEQEGMIFSDWLEQTWGDKVRILKFDYRPGTIDVYRAWNNGFRNAEYDWCIYTSCDAYFAPDWDKILAEFIVERDVTDVCVPQFINLNWREYNEPQIIPALELKYPNNGVLRESELVEWFKNLPRDDSIKEELGGPRKRATWNPLVIDRDLFFELGGFIEDPPWPDSHDLHFDDTLGAHGITKKICTDTFVAHGKSHIILDL